MLDEVDRGDRWGRALSTPGLPLVTLPFLMLPQGTQAYAVGPVLAAFVLLRRRVLPRLFPSSAALPNR